MISLWPAELHNTQPPLYISLINNCVICFLARSSTGYRVRVKTSGTCSRNFSRSINSYLYHQQNLLWLVQSFSSNYDRRAVFESDKNSFSIGLVCFVGRKKITLCIIIGSKFNHGRKQVLVISLIISFGPFLFRFALNRRIIPMLNYTSIAKLLWLVGFFLFFFFLEYRTRDIVKRSFQRKNSRLQNLLTLSILATSPVWSHPLSSSDSLVFSSFHR